SALNFSKISETQDTTVPTNNRIKVCKLNSNSKRAKKEKHVNHNMIDTDESNTNLSEKNIDKFVYSIILHYIKLVNNYFLKLIELALNSHKMPKIQDTTSFTNNRTSKLNKKNAKKGKQVDHNAPANVNKNDLNDNNKGTKKEKQVNYNTPININKSYLNNAKKEKQFDYNAPININESDSNLLEKD
ncbi:16058_t:CDS:1, partial [Cetraspora pellucida]